MIEIVRANLENKLHQSALIDLMNLYVLDQMGGGKSLSSYVKDNLAATLNRRNDAFVILAYDNNEAVGLVTCLMGFSTFQCKPLLNIHDAIVRQEYRGQGISRMLLTEAENIAIENNCCKLTLEVLEGNKVAQAAYSNYGFSGYELNPEMGKALFWEKKL